MNRTEIVNLALSAIGHPRIQSLTEGSVVANKAATLLPVSISAIVRQFNWPCQIERQYLAQVSVPETASRAYCYELPSDMVRALGLVSEEQFEREGRHLFTDDPQALLRYVSSPGETICDDLLCQAISLHLAARLAVDIANSGEKQARLQAELNQLLEEAKMQAASEGISDNSGVAFWYPDSGSGER